MHAHSESEIRKSFLNCSKGAAQRLAVPKDLDQIDWDAQIILGWTDPKSPKAAYLVVETDDGLRGLVMEKSTLKGNGGARMCQLCLTLHTSTGVSMFSIQRSKSAKDRYSSVGTYICTDLACSDYTVGRHKPDGVRQMEETLSLEERSQRTLENAQGLVQRVAQSLGR
ncbi:FBP domain-containing protein [Kocuria palustris]